MIGLVACSSSKLDRAAPAAEIYTSDLFRKARAVVELECSRWAILSAKHGLLLPDDVVEPYDVTLARMSARERKEWVTRTRAQLRKIFGEKAEFFVLAGANYREALDGLPHAAPLAGLGIGEQLAWLKERLVTLRANPLPWVNRNGLGETMVTTTEGTRWFKSAAAGRRAAARWIEDRRRLLDYGLVLPMRKDGVSVRDDMAKRKAKEEEEQESSRRKDPEDLVKDPYGVYERKPVSIKMRLEFWEAIEKHRDGKSWAVAMHRALEAGLVELGWIKPPKGT